MKKIRLFLLAMVISTASFAQTDSATVHAKKLLELMGSVKVAMQVMNSMSESYKKALPSVPTEFWDQFMKEVDPKDLLDLMAPIYVKHYSDEDMKQLIAFYKSPLGQKVTEKLPLITQDSYFVGQEWGKKLGEKIIMQLRAKGFMQSN